ncbi:MAG: M1 family aminopeptidase [Candidatus Krumholzibacteriia bacterium]
MSRVGSSIAAALAAAVLTLAPPAAPAGGVAPLLHHDVGLVFDVEAHAVEVVDRLQVPSSVTELRLGSGFTVEEVVLEKDGVRREPVPDRVRRSDDGREWIIDLTPFGSRDGWTLVLAYQGTFHQSTADVTFSRERVGGEITATISDEGIYLSDAAGWLARATGALATHTVTTDTPSGFDSVTQGERTVHELVHDRVRGDRRITTWTAEHPADGITLVAAPYVVSQAAAGAGDRVTVYTFLLEDDARLRDLYVERTRHYLTMYEEMLGPYPFAKFATVENWFPTGYGMPGWTLLGSQVLRLPFIPYTSFGHEICHNWWGNSVLVADEGGNWCEGLTVYCADYHYEVQESAAEAREYRRNLLKDYAAYVRNADADFPLVSFESRHSGATRAVGYGKSMFVFHMVDRMIGREAFVESLRDVVRGFTFRPAAWSDFFAAFATRSDREFGDFHRQWVERTGAPSLRLERARRDGDRVEFTLAQGAPPYVLDVPVVLTTPAGTQEHVVSLDRTVQHYVLEVPGATRLAVDPDHHVFRRLLPGEVEPTIARVLAEERPIFSLPPDAPEFVGPGEAFAGSLVAQGPPIVLLDGETATDLPAAQAASHYLVRTGGEGLERYLPGELTIAAGAVFLDGRRHDLDDHDLVAAVTDPYHPQVTDLVVVTRSPERLAGLGRRIAHYGKSSWLLLPAGGGPVLRGNWPPPGQPLAADLEH